jgi:hypothetical protein
MADRGMLSGWCGTDAGSCSKRDYLADEHNADQLVLSLSSFGQSAEKATNRFNNSLGIGNILTSFGFCSPWQDIVVPALAVLEEPRQ